MAFRQFTQCVQPGEYSDLSFNLIGVLNIIGYLVTGGFAVVLVAAIAGGPVVLMAFIALFVLVVMYLRWWLHGRLICLDDQPCLIGMVRKLSPAEPLEKGGDDDFSMNILLAPGPTALIEDFGQPNRPDPPPPVSAYQGALQGRLVSPQPSILGIGRTYVDDEGHLAYVTSLHCEFEGSGIYNMLILAGIILGLLVAALALMLFLPGLGQLSQLLILLAILFGGTGLLTGPLAGPLAAGAGHPTDVDESLKSLERGDIVVVKGEWVYDSLHGGWNEIHPVRACCKIGVSIPIGGEWPAGLRTDAEVQVTRDRWCRMLDDADDCEDGGNRDDPRHDWVIHPLVDGCRPPIVIL